jgi:predicted nuclease with TOPRIM domain
MNEVDLMELKQDIEDAKQKVSELKGERQALLKQLKEEWGCETIEQAEEKIKELNAELESVSEKISEGTKKLEVKMGELSEYK